MERNVIYFPYIKVPKNSWFYRVLLYWDNVSSILPHSFHSEKKLGPFMYELIEEKMLKPLYPNEKIKKIPKFNDTFLNFISKKEYLKNKKITENKNLPITQLHFDKIETIGNSLVDLGLAKKADSPWYNVEEYTANIYMAYLASAIGQLPDINSKPTTDTIKNLNAFASPDFLKGRFRTDLEQRRALILEDFLPAPEGNINPREISDFKDENKYELGVYQNKVESFLIEYISTEPSLRLKKYQEFRIEFQREIDNMVNLMNQSGWENINLGDFITYLGLGAGLGVTAASGNPALLATSAVGILGKSYSLLKNIQKSELMNEERIRNSYAAYAVLAQKKFNKH